MSVCFTANCLLGTFGFSVYADGCFEGSVLSSGSFEEDTCIVTPFTLGGISHTASFKITCEQHIEEEERFAGYLPVVATKSANTVRRLAFELILGGISAADLTVAVITRLRRSVTGMQSFSAVAPSKCLCLPCLCVNLFPPPFIPFLLSRSCPSALHSPSLRCFLLCSLFCFSH